MENKDTWTDNLKELISGGYIMLFIFGLTICLMASTSLIATFLTTNPEKIATFSKVLDTLIGFIAGAYTTMWNNQHFKDSKNGNGQTTNGGETK